MTAVVVERLVKHYPTRSGPVVAVDGVSFRVDQGEIVGLLGANGAGKTTTIKCILGLILPTSGRVEVLGVPSHQPQVARYVAAVLEGARNVYWRLSVEENLAFFAGLQGLSPRRARPRINKLIHLFGLEKKRKAVANLLSQGMKQKLAVACALVKDTEVVLLDEPTLGLDVETSHELRRLIRELAEEEGRTVLLSSHDMGVVEETCQRVVILAQGKVVTDDRVDRLLKLFRTRAWSIAVAGELAQDTVNRLQAKFPFLKLHSSDHGARLEVELAPGQDFYELLDLLREEGVELEGISQVEPDLEEVFLKIVRGEGR